MRDPIDRLVPGMLLLMCLATVAVAQPAGRAGAEAPAPETIRIRHLHGLNRRARVQTPAFQTSVGRTATRPRDWVEVRVVYDTAPEWIDELVIEYFVLMADQVRDRRVFSLFQKAVRYGDVAAGRGRQGTAYLRPPALERFGEVVAVAVEISHDGRTAAVETDTGMQLPERWWRNPLVLESPDLTVRDGYLLNRAESPWALINIDDYEGIR